MKTRLLCCLLVVVGCAGKRPTKPPPVPTKQPAPSLIGSTVLVLPVQEGPVPAADASAGHWAADRDALDTEIAYWLQQGRPRVKWILPATMDRMLARTPGLGIKLRALEVGAFHRAQVKNIGDPLFGDLRRLAAVLDAPVAVVPVAAEFIGATPETATLNVAIAVIKTYDGSVLWFGIIEGREKGVGSGAAVATAAQAFANAFAGKQTVGENQ